MSAVAVREAGRVRSFVDFYLTTMRTSVIVSFQYRVGQYFYMLGMIAEPVIYIVVWSSVARSSGGSVNGITPSEFAAYYIVWMLVRNMNIVFGAPYWEWRIREGQLNGQLLKPLHPLNYDLAWFAGSKVVVVLLWLPIAVALSLVFHPALHPSVLDGVVFFFALWGAYLIRTMIQSTFGMLCFWTTRGQAVFDLYMTTELLLSGRLVPLKLMPGWVQTLASFLPFKYAFYYPIETLVGNLSTGGLLRGLALQLLWIAIGFVVFRFAWRAAIKRYSGVGG
jgi:ABC-2 type transport system permease protein